MIKVVKFIVSNGDIKQMILAGILLMVIIFGPNFWTRRILRKYNYCRNDIPGTGGDFANHLLKQLKLKNYKVKAGNGHNIDHYDPKTQTITLSKNYYESNSLTAIVIAAHEIGHALQDANQSKLLHIRTKLVKASIQFEKVASLLLVSAPLLAILFKIPLLGVGALVLVVTIMGLPILLHLITLPLEYDASFNKAMPILKAGYINGEDIRFSKKILTACALTYFSSSLASLLNFYRWIKIWQR